MLVRFRVVACIWCLGLLLSARAQEGVAPNQPPSFHPGPDIEANEDDASQVYPAWATSISSGLNEESGQSVRFEVTNKDSTLFAVPPSVDSSGNLTFTPAHGANGSAVVTVVAVDDGGTENGGSNVSDPVDFLITIHPVNDAPVFEIRDGPVVTQDSGPATFPNWAYRIGPGSQFEVGQSFTFEIINEAPELFFEVPAISPDGTLSFTPAPGVHGVAKLSVILHDSGGTERGGIDTSRPVSFTIGIVPLNRAPVAVVKVVDCCWLSSSSSEVVLIAPDKKRCLVEFDGSESYDVDGGPLSFEWFIDAMPVVGANRLELFQWLDEGKHLLTLVVGDASDESVANVHVEVIAASEAVEVLMSELVERSLSRRASRELQKLLRRAAADFERGHMVAGVRQLILFERETRWFALPRHRGDALIEHSREIRTAVGASLHGR